MISGINNFLRGEDFAIVFLAMVAIIVVLLVGLIIALVQVFKLKNNYNEFMSGADGESLEFQIKKHIETVDELVRASRKSKQDIDALRAQIKLTFQKIGVVKYNALQEMGGKLSFSLAMLNEMNDGFVLNAMHTREGCYTYIKEIVGGKSMIMLSDEEAEALSRAINYK